MDTVQQGVSRPIGGLMEIGVRISDRLDSQTNTLLDALFSHAHDVRGKRYDLTRRVADCAESIALVMDLDDSLCEAIRRAAALRDVGKAGLPDSILQKKGPLTAREYDEVRMRMLPEGDTEDSESVRRAIQIAHHHHERVDGQGYPDQLKGDDIPIGARILAVAEAYETMLVETPWRTAKTPAEALKELSAGVGASYDREVVQGLARTLGLEFPLPEPPVS